MEQWRTSLLQAGARSSFGHQLRQSPEAGRRDWNSGNRPDDDLPLHRHPHSEDGFDVDLELTLHGVTRPVTLALDVNGFTRD